MVSPLRSMSGAYTPTAHSIRGLSGANKGIPHDGGPAAFKDKFYGSFDGVSKHATRPGSEESTLVPYDQPRTVAIWLKTTKIGGQNILGNLSSGGTPGMQIGMNAFTTGLAHVWFEDGAKRSIFHVSAGSKLLATDGSWQLLVVSWDGEGSFPRFWVNGEEASISVYENGMTGGYSGAGTFHIGRNGPASSYFNGGLNDIAIYGAAADQALVDAIWNGGTPGDRRADANLLAYWTFDVKGDDLTGGTGKIQDASGNGYTLTPQNTEASDLTPF